MNNFNGFLDDIGDFFTGGESDVGSATGYTGAGDDSFGFNFDDWLGGGASTTTIVPGLSDDQKTAWDEYLATGGVMQPDFTPNNQSSSQDLFGGIGDFFSSLTTNLPNLIGLGLNTYANIQGLLDQQERATGTRDTFVTLPGSNTPVIRREQGGNVTYQRVADLYPSLVPAVQQNKSQNLLVGIALAGALGLGLVFILKKK